MKTARVALRLSEDLVARIDAARGDVNRTRWIERALESALLLERLRTLDPGDRGAGWDDVFDWLDLGTVGALESALKETKAADVASDVQRTDGGRPEPSAPTRAPVKGSYNEAMVRQERLNKAKAGKR